MASNEARKQITVCTASGESWPGLSFSTGLTVYAELHPGIHVVAIPQYIVANVINGTFDQMSSDRDAEHTV
jgi:hypothetical protein